MRTHQHKSKTPACKQIKFYINSNDYYTSISARIKPNSTAAADREVYHYLVTSNLVFRHQTLADFNNIHCSHR